MQRKSFIHKAGLMLLPLLLALVLSLSSCGTVWSWMWSRDHEPPVDSADLILGGQPTDEDWIFEGAVSFTGEAHGGTDIYYVGDRESPNCTRVIVIDAGHQLKGNSDTEPEGPGAETQKMKVSQGSEGKFTGQAEFDLNLQVALLLRNELIRRGYSVVMIRETNNVSISNKERAEIANKYNAAAFIRIHANGSLDETVHGALTICQSTSNPYPDCARHYERSRLLSELVLDSFCRQTEIHQLKVYEMDNMTGTNWSRVPTTIVEMGYLSNRSDDELMNSTYFYQEAAVGIANGLDAYFKALDDMVKTEDAESSYEPAENPAVDVPTEIITEIPQEEPTEALTEFTPDTPTEAFTETDGMDTEVIHEDPVSTEEATPSSKEIPEEAATAESP